MRLISPVLAALALLAAPAAQAQPNVGPAVAAPTPVSNFAGITAWSEPSPQQDGYRLMIRRPGRDPEPAAIPVRRIPFDVDLGEGRDGARVAVYSRCRVEPPVSSAPSLPVYTAGRGCDLFQFDLRTGQEARIDSVSTPHASEVLPSTAGSSMAFARVYDQRGGRRDGYDLRKLPYLYVRDLRAGKTTRRLAGDDRGTAGVPGPRALDFDGRRVAFIWEYTRRSESPRFRAAIRELSGGRRVAAQAGGGGMARVWFTAAALDGNALFIGLDCLGVQGGCANAGLQRRALRYSLTTGALAAATLPSDRVVSLDVDGSRVAMVGERLDAQRAPGRGCTPPTQEAGIASVCEILELPAGELSFGRAPARLRP